MHKTYEAYVAHCERVGTCPISQTAWEHLQAPVTLD